MQPEVRMAVWRLDPPVANIRRISGMRAGSKKTIIVEAVLTQFSLCADMLNVVDTVVWGDVQRLLEAAK